MLRILMQLLLLTQATQPAEDRALVELAEKTLERVRAAATQPSIEQKIRPFLDAAEAARSLAPFRINALALCSSVRQFGVYDPLPDNRLASGTPFILYCELENWRSKDLQNGLWEARFFVSVTVYISSNPSIPVYSLAPQPILDRCRTRRRDLFIAEPIKLPHPLKAGRYLVAVTVTDELANRIAESAANLDITD